jgi:hypothetical protein
MLTLLGRAAAASQSGSVEVAIGNLVGSYLAVNGSDTETECLGKHRRPRFAAKSIVPGLFMKTQQAS